MFGTSRVFLPARALLELDGVDLVTPDTVTTYIHLLFDGHEVIFANGQPSESLFIGTNAITAFSKDQVEEIQLIFPELCDSNTWASLAAFEATMKMNKKLISRHIKNAQPLWQNVMPKQDYSAAAHLH